MRRNVQKSYLSGLAPSSNNRAEQLLAAIILTASRNFIGFLEDELDRTITDNLGASIDFDNSSLYDQLVIEQWKTLIVGNKIQHTFLVHQFEEYEN